MKLASMAPPGFMRPKYSHIAQGSLDVAASTKTAESERAAAKAKAMQIAWSPGKSLFGLFMMMFMIGSQLTVFSVFFLIPVLTGPISQLMNVHAGRFAANETAMKRKTYLLWHSFQQSRRQNRFDDRKAHIHSNELCWLGGWSVQSE